MTDKPTHYILSNGAAIFVKTAEFFAAQGGLTEDWGRAWRPVVAGNIEDARALGDLMFPETLTGARPLSATAQPQPHEIAPDRLIPFPEWLSRQKLAEIRRNLALGANLPQVTQRFLLAVMIDEVARLRGAGRGAPP